MKLHGRQGRPGDPVGYQVLARVAGQVQKGLVGLGDSAFVVAEGDAEHVGVDDPAQPHVAFAKQAVVVGQPADLLVRSDAPDDRAAGVAQRRDARVVENAAPLDSHRRLVTCECGEVSVDQRMVLAAVEDDLLKRTAQHLLRREAEVAEDRALREREHEPRVRHPDRRRDAVEEWSEARAGEQRERLVRGLAEPVGWEPAREWIRWMVRHVSDRVAGMDGTTVFGRSTCSGGLRRVPQSGQLHARQAVC